MIFFKTYKQALAFSQKNDKYEFQDLGENAPRRWAVKVL